MKKVAFTEKQYLMPDESSLIELIGSEIDASVTILNDQFTEINDCVRCHDYIPKETAAVLIQWTDLLAFQAPWEPMKTILKQFPSFHLEGR